jgi:glyoxylase-like metal-dependent hydrolase (beta-lactamase superfamily II)
MKRKTSLAALSGLLLAGFISSVFLGAPAARAAAPMAKTSAPGFYRLMIGKFQVTALSDGTIDLPVDKLLTHISPAEVDARLTAAFETSPLESSDNAYLINTGAKLILVDTGAGVLYGPTFGKLRQNLEAAGYQPDQVDEVIVTHMHPDHIGGLLVDGKEAFPNAIVLASRLDADYWLSKKNLAAAPAAQKAFFKGPMAVFAPYIADGKFKSFDGALQIAPGVRSVPLPGHTPGHTGYMVESEGQRLLIWGDTVNVAAIQFADPRVGIAFDGNPAEAAREREKIFKQAARERYLVAGAHLPFPGLGHVQKAGKGYAWVPLNYSVLR